MTSETDAVPPVPQLIPPIVQEGPGRNRFHNSWMQWFVQLRDKINVINQSLVNLGNLVSAGFTVKDADGNWVTRSIEGTAGEILVVNGDGISGNPVISIDPSFSGGGGASLDLAFDGGTIGTSYDDSIDGLALPDRGVDTYDRGTIS